MSYFYSRSLHSLTFKKMSQHYDSLLKSGLQSDVVLVAGEKEICVHKLILSARSPVFAAMFAHSTTKEAQENRVEIVDMDEEVLELFVRYIYTGKVETLDQYAGDLLIAADKYQLASLKSICEAHLLSVVITTETVSDLLFLADMYQITELATKCLEYIAHNGTQVMATEGWKRIRVKPHLLEKLFALSSAKFSKVFDAGDRFGKMMKKFNAKQKPPPFKMASFNSLIFEEMSQHYELLLKSELHSDLVLVAGEKEFKVHKLILSTRAPVFFSMFASHESTKEEQKKNRVEIVDVKAEVFELLVRYIYTGNVDDNLDRYAAVDLFLTADKYQLDSLKSVCEQRLMSKITAESISDLFLFADKHKATNLFTECLGNFVCYGTRVMNSDGWKKIVRLRTDLLAKICEQSQYLYKINSRATEKKKVELKKEDYSDIDWTVGADLNFVEDLLKCSNAIDCKEEMSEVILVVGDAQLKAHKSILSAQSPVFAAMFASTNDENRLEIVDLDLNVLKLLVMFIYTGKVDGWGYNAGKLLVAAHKYQVDSLKSICVQQLLSQEMFTDSVLDILILADTYQIINLYSKCLDYITDNCAQVIASEDWKKIVLKADLMAKICEHLNLDLTEELLLGPITTETVSNLLILADKHQMTELTTKCLDYITAKHTQVKQHEDWKKIEASGDLLVKLFERLSLKYHKVTHMDPFDSDYEYEDYYDDYDRYYEY